MTQMRKNIEHNTFSVKVLLYRWFIKRFNLSIPEDDFIWAMAYADLRRYGILQYYVRLLGRLVLFLTGAPFNIWESKQLLYADQGNDNIILNREHARENLIYNNYVTGSSHFAFCDKHIKPHQDFVLVFFICLITDFYSIRKSQELAAIIRCFEKESLDFDLYSKNYYAHDGANPSQRLLLLYLREFKIRTYRVIAHDEFQSEKYFDEDIVLQRNNQLLNSEITSWKKIKGNNDFISERLIIGEPGTFRIFGIKLKLLKLALKLKFQSKSFVIKLHPQCSPWKGYLLALLVGRQNVLPPSIELHGVKVILLIIDYPTSLYKFIVFQHCLRIK